MIRIVNFNMTSFLFLFRIPKVITLTPPALLLCRPQKYVQKTYVFILVLQENLFCFVVY